MTPPMDRRTFFRTSAGLALGAVAWACSNGGDDPDAGDAPSSSAAAGAISVLAGSPTMAIGDTRQAIVILRGQRPIAPQGLKVMLSGPEIEPFEVEADKQEITRGLGGEDLSDGHEHAAGTEVEEIFVVRHDFDRPGTWDAAVSFDGGKGTVAFQVLDDASAPKVGDDAIATKSATTDNPRDVDPICTRDPVCTMHEVTIAEALEAKKPLVISFATPRFCASRACGPVIDLLEAEKARVGDDVTFVHIEVWKDDDESVNKVPAAAFSEWKLDSEPWTYFVGADGKVKDRWLGPVGRAELTKAIDALLA